MRAWLMYKNQLTRARDGLLLPKPRGRTFRFAEKAIQTAMKLWVKGVHASYDECCHVLKQCTPRLGSSTVAVLVL